MQCGVVEQETIQGVVHDYRAQRMSDQEQMRIVEVAGGGPRGVDRLRLRPDGLLDLCSKFVEAIHYVWLDIRGNVPDIFDEEGSGDQAHDDEVEPDDTLGEEAVRPDRA